jgi:hypothetical protein
MTEYDARMKKLALSWKRAAPALLAMRHADIRRQNNAQAIEALNSLFREAIRRSPPRKSSGFVQMYEILKRRSKR